MPEKFDFRNGRREGFVDWLTAPDNPLFARVAVNRIWQWHFGAGLHKNPSDFGLLGGTPAHRKLLDWLASEFVNQKYSMKALHRLIVTSDTYKLASRSSNAAVVTANQQVDPENTFLWRFRLQRLDAEAVWDSLLYSSGNLDMSLGGPSFQVAEERRQRSNAANNRGGPVDSRTNRRGPISSAATRRARTLLRTFCRSLTWTMAGSRALFELKQ